MTYWPKPPRPKPAKRTERAPRRVQTHVMLRGQQETHDGKAICEACGHPSDHRVHDLTVLTEDVAIVDARRIGEGIPDD